MILFCLFFFAAFPLAALIPTSVNKGNAGLTTDASAFFKGAAICFVVISVFYIGNIVFSIYFVNAHLSANRQA